MFEYWAAFCDLHKDVFCIVAKSDRVTFLFCGFFLEIDSAFLVEGSLVVAKLDPAGR